MKTNKLKITINKKPQTNNTTKNPKIAPPPKKNPKTLQKPTKQPTKKIQRFF